MTLDNHVPDHCRPTVILELHQLMRRIQAVAELADSGQYRDTHTAAVGQGLMAATGIIEKRIAKVGIEYVTGLPRR